MLPDKNSQIFHDGYAAYYRNIPQNANPYLQHPAADEWRIGWQAAARDDDSIPDIALNVGD